MRNKFSKRSSAAIGAAGEELMHIYHEHALRWNVAMLHKVATPTKNIGGGEIVYAEKSTVDYVGMMMDGTGTHIAEEVKVLPATGIFYLIKLKPHQRAYLEEVHKQNGIAVLTLVTQRNDVYTLPWSTVWSHVNKGHGKLVPVDYIPYKETIQTYLRRFLKKEENNE